MYMYVYSNTTARGPNEFIKPFKPFKPLKPFKPFKMYEVSTYWLQYTYKIYLGGLQTAQ